MLRIQQGSGPTGAAQNWKHTCKACRATAPQQHRALCTIAPSHFAFHNVHLCTWIHRCGAVASCPALLGHGQSSLHPSIKLHFDFP